MKQNRLDSIMIIFVKREWTSQIYLEDIINELKSMHPGTRHIEL